MLVRRARRRDHASSDCLAKLDGKTGDAARPTLDQDRLATLEFQRILNRTQGREAGKRQSGGIDMGQIAWLLGDDSSFDSNLFRVGALLSCFANTEH